MIPGVTGYAADDNFSYTSAKLFKFSGNLSHTKIRTMTKGI